MTYFADVFQFRDASGHIRVTLHMMLYVAKYIPDHLSKWLEWMHIEGQHENAESCNDMMFFWKGN